MLTLKRAARPNAAVVPGCPVRVRRDGMDYSASVSATRKPRGALTVADLVVISPGTSCYAAGDLVGGVPARHLTPVTGGRMYVQHQYLALVHASRRGDGRHVTALLEHMNATDLQVTVLDAKAGPWPGFPGGRDDHRAAADLLLTGHALDPGAAVLAHALLLLVDEVNAWRIDLGGIVDEGCWEIARRIAPPGGSVVAALGEDLSPPAWRRVHWLARHVRRRVAGRARAAK